RAEALSSLSTAAPGSAGGAVPATVHAQTLAAQFNHDQEFEMNPGDKLTVNNGDLFLGSRPLPPLPQKLTPSQAARLAELLEFLHRHLTLATENIHAGENATQVTLSYADWQRVLGLQMILARYVRSVSEPDVAE